MTLAQIISLAGHLIGLDGAAILFGAYLCFRGANKL